MELGIHSSEAIIGLIGRILARFCCFHINLFLLWGFLLVTKVVVFLLRCWLVWLLWILD